MEIIDFTQTLGFIGVLGICGYFQDKILSYHKICKKKRTLSKILSKLYALMIILLHTHTHTRTGESHYAACHCEYIVIQNSGSKRACIVIYKAKHKHY